MADIYRLRAVLILVCGLAGAAGCSTAQVQPSAVVTVLAMDFQKIEPSKGSGFFVAPRLVVTCRHVIDKRYYFYQYKGKWIDKGRRRRRPGGR